MDGPDGLFRDLLGIRGNERNRVAGVPHVFLDEGLLVLEGDAKAVHPGDVLCRQDAGHALHGRGLPRVDLIDQRMRDAGAKNPAVKHVRKRDVL